MRNKEIHIALLPLLVCLAAVLPAMGREDKPIPKETAAVVQVSGRVRRVGNEPFSELVISGHNREWHIDKDDEYQFNNLQHSLVTVEGIETIEKLTYVNGRSAGELRILKNIRIISVQPAPGLR